MNKIGKKYNLDSIKLLSPDLRHNIQKMFSIVYASSMYLLNEANAIKKDQLTLELEDYLSIDENEKLMFEISSAIGLMNKKLVNYEVVVLGLVNASKMVRNIGGYRNDVRIGLHGSISFDELC